MPGWLTALSMFSLGVALLCALWIALDIVRGHRQRMAIMHVVWPVTALYAGPLALWAYYRWGRPRTKAAAERRRQAGQEDRSPGGSVAVAATHCGSGCTLGDLAAESLLIVYPFTWFGSELLTGWTLDFIAAFVLGIAFQYFSIKPMTGQSAGQALLSALKADSLSLTAWQVGMYGWMAIATFLLFRHPLDKASPVFWFMMQLAMLLGFLVAYPVNAWLLRRGIKERM